MTIKGHRQLEEVVGALDTAKRLLDKVVLVTSDAEQEEIYFLAESAWNLSARAARSIPKEIEE